MPVTFVSDPPAPANLLRFASDIDSPILSEEMAMKLLGLGFGRRASVTT